MVEEVAIDTTEEPTPDIVVGSDEYNKQMADKFDASQESTPEDTEEKVEIPEKPDGIPAKFYNKATGEVDYASLTKSYNELEKGRGKVKATPDATPKVNSDDAVVLAKVRHDEAKTKADAEGATQEDAAGVGTKNARAGLAVSSCACKVPGTTASAGGRSGSENVGHLQIAKG